MYWKIMKWYKDGIWTLQMVRNAVVKGKITEEQYQKITGQEY